MSFLEIQEEQQQEKQVQADYMAICVEAMKERYMMMELLSTDMDVLKVRQIQTETFMIATDIGRIINMEIN